MNIALYYIFEAGLLILIAVAVVFAFLEATRPQTSSPDTTDESTQD